MAGLLLPGLIVKPFQRYCRGIWPPVEARLALLALISLSTRDSIAVAPKLEPPSSRRIAWLMLKPDADLLDDERVLAKAVDDHCPALKTASALARGFAELVRQKRVGELDGWIDEASS